MCRLRDDIPHVHADDGNECKVEHNTEKFHSWDVVKIDGDWYITDIYSDAGKEIMRTLM